MNKQSNNQIRAMTLSSVTMQQAVEKLRDMRIPACFEQIALIPERAKRMVHGRIEYERRHFETTIPGGTISAALDALCSADPDYTWEQVGSRPTYFIYPTKGSALTWHVPSKDFTGMDWVAVIQGLDLDQHHIALFPRGLERQPRATLSASVSSETMMRRWLTAVVDYINQGRYWTLGGVVGSRTLVIGQTKQR